MRDLILGIVLGMNLFLGIYNLIVLIIERNKVMAITSNITEIYNDICSLNKEISETREISKYLMETKNQKLYEEERRFE